MDSFHLTRTHSSYEVPSLKTKTRWNKYTFIFLFCCSKNVQFGKYKFGRDSVPRSIKLLFFYNRKISKMVDCLAGISAMLIENLPKKYSFSCSTVQRRAQTKRNFPLQNLSEIPPLPCVAGDNLQIIQNEAYK